jgi:hypothetical protein
MGYTSQYNRNVTGQMKSIMTRPTAGLNEYTPASGLNDNYFSKSINVSDYRNEALIFKKVETNSLLDSD